MVDEHQLPRKEVPEVDQFGIPLDDFIGRRLERKTNGQPKGTFPTWALMTGLHDAVAGTGDGHPALFGHAAAEFHRGEVIGVVLGRAGRAEDRDFANIFPAMEDVVGVPHLSHGGSHQPNLALVVLGTTDPKHGLADVSQHAVAEVGVIKTHARQKGLHAFAFVSWIRSHGDQSLRNRLQTPVVATPPARWKWPESRFLGLERP